MGVGVADGTQLGSGSRIAVIGGGPAGAMCAHFLLDLAGRDGRDISVDIYDAKDFMAAGPKGCNHCGGIISESLVQHLASEGIVLPDGIIQRGIDAYVLHVDTGSADIATPLREKRIAATYRGAGPRGAVVGDQGGFDAFLLDLAVRGGARAIRDRVDRVDFSGERPRLTTKGGATATYDLIVGAMGVNAAPRGLLDQVHLDHRPARTTRTFIGELRLGADSVAALLGDAMHVFLLDIPRLQFAAIIPKGEYATLVLLGDAIDKDLLGRFLAAPAVRECFPADVDLADLLQCQCYPRINVRGATRPFADRCVLVGDVGATKLYKNGIGAAYLTARAAAAAAVFGGVSARSFERHYWPTCRRIEQDNRLGRLIFGVTALVKRLGFLKGAFLRLIRREQGWPGRRRRLSLVMWDTFTGSAPYRDILGRMLHPVLLFNIIGEIVMGIFGRGAPRERPRAASGPDLLGKVYEDGEDIVTQGDLGDCMYVVRSGEVRVVSQTEGREVHLATIGPGGFFGEMALFGRETRTATVRAAGRVSVLTVDQHTLLRQVTEQPSLAFRLIQELTSRLNHVNGIHARVLENDRRDWETRPLERAGP